jgi:hypothetical protein
VIGSILGARAGKGNSFLASAASMVGSAMASQAAAALVKTVHEDSTQRVLEKQDRDAAIARGENVPESSSSERLLKDAFGAVQKMAAAAAAFATPLSQDMPNATNEQSHSAQFQSNAGFQRNVSFGNNGSIRFTFGNGSNTNSARTRTNSARMRANSTRGRNSFT